MADHIFTEAQLASLVEGVRTCEQNHAHMLRMFYGMIRLNPLLFIAVYTGTSLTIPWPETPTIDNIKGVYPELSRDEFAKVKVAYGANRKVDAIKALRTIHRMSLLEAKQIVEAWAAAGTL